MATMPSHGDARGEGIDSRVRSMSVLESDFGDKTRCRIAVSRLDRLRGTKILLYDHYSNCRTK